MNAAPIEEMTNEKELSTRENCPSVNTSTGSIGWLLGTCPGGGTDLTDDLYHS